MLATPFNAIAAGHVQTLWRGPMNLNSLCPTPLRGAFVAAALQGSALAQPTQGPEQPRTWITVQLPTRGLIKDVLSNALYAGAYVYGRRLCAERPSEVYLQRSLAGEDA